MSSNEMSVDIMQRIVRYRKFVRIWSKAKREEKISKEDIEFLDKLSFIMDMDLINGVQLPATERRIVLGDMSIEPKLLEIKNRKQIELLNILGDKCPVSECADIYFD
jgi:hypothetical protein